MRFRFFLLFIISFFSTLLNAQEQTTLLKKSLVSNGFENVRVKKIENKVYVSFEDNQYRWYVDGIFAAIENIEKYSDGEPVSVIILNNGIPSVGIDLEYVPADQGKAKLVLKQVTFEFEQNWNLLKNEVPENRPKYKMDVIVDPQLTIKNTNFDHIYHIRFSLAPVLQTSLWPGMLLEGQLIFPVKNDFDLEGKVIRPGFITVSQGFRLPYNWFGRAVLGNFNENRYGMDVNLKHPWHDSNWSTAFRAGFTGTSTFSDGRWVKSNLNTFTWLSGIGFYYPKYAIQMDMAFGRFINNDYGFRADCTRHFGCTAIGFYATCGEGPFNGGFHFSIPLAPRKQNRKHLLRVVASKYFDQEYNANADFNFCRYYETRYNENRSEQWFHPRFIRNELIKMLKNGKYDL